MLWRISFPAWCRVFFKSGSGFFAVSSCSVINCGVCRM